MKHLRIIILLLLVGIGTLGMSAHDFEVNGIYYNKNGTNAIVTYKGNNCYDYSEYSGAVNIPSTITFNGTTYSVTKIGDEAFSDCSGLTSVTIPNSVTTIGNSSFWGCSGLTSVTIPNSVTSIGGSAFSGCSGLTSVTIPNSVTTIGSGAFQGTKWYNNQPDGLVYAGMLAYEYKGTMPNGTSIVLMDGCTGIVSYCFYGCSGLTSLTIPNSVTSIGNSAFRGCSGLTSVTIPNSVTSIGSSAFEGCSGLTSVTIPNSVTTIGSWAFEFCSGLTSMVVESGNTKYDSRNNCNAIIKTESNTLLFGCKNTIIPNSVTTIGSYAFRGCSGLASVTIPNSVTSIGSQAFEYCSGLTSVTIPNSVTTIGDGAFEGTLWYNNQLDGLVYAGMVAYKYKGTMPNGTSIVLMDGCIGISSNCFYNCSGLTSLTIPNSVTTIGSLAFFNCSGLTSLTIPNSVTTIGHAAFGYCSGLTSVTIPNSVTTIGGGAFEYCSGLTSVTIPNSVTSIGSSAFEGCSSLTSVTLNNNSIVSKNHPYYNTIAKIFGQQVEHYIIGNSVMSIGNWAFYGCSGLTSVTIPNSVTSIGDAAFRGCTGLTSLTIPNSVTTIGEGAFYSCSGMTAVSIGNSVTTIGEYAFDGCSGLTSLTIPNSVTTINYHTFYNCTGLTSVTIPSSVTTIGSSAFDGCTGLTTVTIPNSVTSIGGGAFSNCTGLTSVTIPNSVTTINYRTFYNCTGLTSVTIPSSVTTIGSSAFDGCTGLTSVTIPNSVTSIGGGAFSNCTGLTSVTIPNSVTTIDYHTFYNCTGLTSVTIPNSVTEISGGAFSGCSGLTSVTIPNSVTSIGWTYGEGVFNGCYNLDSITCEGIEPPRIYSDLTFSNYNSTLIVPYEGYIKYRTAHCWKNFKNISSSGWFIDFSSSDDVIEICRGIDADFSVPILMQNSHPITALQCSVESSISIEDIVMSNSRNGGDHTLSYNNNKILIASPTLKTFKGDSGTLFNFNLHTDVTEAGKIGEITLSDILLSTKYGEGVYYSTDLNIPIYMTYLVGDANGDGSVDAADYVVTCNKIALRPVTTFFQDAANVNEDIYLDVSDLVGITRIALGLDESHMHGLKNTSQHTDGNTSVSKVSSHDIEFSDCKTATLTINLNSAIAYKAMQMDVTLPAGLRITDAHLCDRAGSLQLMTGETEDGLTRIVASTMGEESIAAGHGSLLTLTLVTDSQWSGDGTISINNIIAATSSAERHEIEAITINATGTLSSIGAIVTDDENSLVDVYNLNGQLVKHNVMRSDAVKGLPTGYYLIDNKKVFVK